MFIKISKKQKKNVWANENQNFVEKASKQTINFTVNLVNITVTESVSK